MQNKIEMLAKGEALREGKDFSLGVEFVKEKLVFGKFYKGSFVVQSKNGKEGIVQFCSTNHRIKFLQNTYSGKEFEVFYTIDTNGLRAGDEIKGNIVAYSEGMETIVPFEFLLEYNSDAAVLHSLKTAEDFYNLFISRPEYVVKLFKDKTFKEADFMQEEKLQAVYDSLMKCDNYLFSLKEFFNKLGYDVSNIIRSPKYKDDIVVKEDYEYEKETEKLCKDLYIEQLEDLDLIEQISSLFIRAGVKNDISFKYFEKSIVNHSNITRLYENFLYSVPKNYRQTFPKEVYLYFSTNENLPYDLAYPLFINIARNLSRQSDIFKTFETQMKEMALDYLYKNKIDDDLACLYDKILTTDMVTENIANMLIYILRYFKVEVLGSDIKNIIIKYKEINGENIFPVYHGTSYATIFFDGFEMLFEDKEGNRYACRNNRIRPMLNRPELEETCYNMSPNMDILKLARLSTLLNNGINSKNELYYALSIYKELDLTDLTLKKLDKLMLDYICKNYELVEEQKNLIDKYIDNLDKISLSKDELRYVMQYYILSNNFKSAFALLSDFDITYFDNLVIKDICSYYLANINSEDAFISSGDKEVLLEVCLFLLQKGIADNKILEYLVNEYDKDTSTMYYILCCCEDAYIPSYQLAKRLLEKYLIIDDVANIDYVFSVFMKQKPENEDEILVLAYVTRSCIGYFLYERELPECTVEPLEQIIFQKLDQIHCIPKVYLYSISKYLSNKDVINANERKMLIILSQYMLNDRIVFEFTKKLYKFVDMKEELANAEYIEYHAKSNEIPKAIISINGGKEFEYELFQVYKNIYVRPITIFKNEVIQYKIFNVKNIDDGILKEGMFVFNPTRNDTYVSQNKIKSSFKYINEAIDLFEKKDYLNLKNTMKEMINREGYTKEFFNI